MAIAAACTAIIKADFFFVDVINAFPSALGLCAILCLILSLIYRTWYWVIISLSAIGCVGYYVQPYLSFFFDSAQVNEGTQLNANRGESSLSILVGNIHVDNLNHSGFASTVFELHPQIVIALETDERWVKELSSSLGSEYPYRLADPRLDAFGLSIFSKLPIKRSQPLLAGKNFPRTFEFFVDRPCKNQGSSNCSVRVIAAHLLPPLSYDWWSRRNAQLEAIGEHLKDSLDTTIVVGDFNSPSWSAPIAQFIENTSLKDARSARCLCNTWAPVYFGSLNSSPVVKNLGDFAMSIFGTPIDHIFYRGLVSLIDLHPVSIPGSDHRGLFAIFSYAEK